MTTAEGQTLDPTAEERRAWLAFSVASLSLFMFVLDSGLLSVALPEIERAFPSTSRATISWLSTGYLLTLAALMLVAGRLGDVYGRRRIFQTGLIILAVGSLLTALAPSVWLLIAARMIQGAAGALTTATALTLVLGDLPAEKRPLAIGLWGSAGSVGATLGPTLGAFLADATSWRFAVSLTGPIALITFFVGRNVLRESTDPDAPPKLDTISVGLAMAGVGGLALGLSQSRVWGLGDPKTITAIVVGALTLVAFIYRSATHHNPVLQLRIFRNPRFSGAVTSGGLQQLGFFSWFFSTSFVLREIWGWSVREAGVALSLAFIFSAVSGVIAGRACERWGYFWPCTVGALLAAAGTLYWIVAFQAEPSFWQVYLPGAALFGAGGGACGTTTTGIALRTISDADQGMAYAANQTLRRMSSAFGLALMAALLGEATGVSLLSGARNVWVLCTVAHIAMIFPILPEWRATRNQPATIS